ncbi:guanine deaminase [Pseudooceanicola sp. CBS1P-1]|uniref:Guanine deaminase n=1 Tax=Pseudooceanicola albus TaxID=2692189 RepID=A0A6L7GA56_9RHOB|nr:MULTISPECIES: guanine deaminase [Pseudooceanicola]MBT9385936.1 guanine deaminase [Pseudooceanicola endophyticus]MXN19643.1 guanine deaminase [Pseudooceanicola albus]
MPNYERILVGTAFHTPARDRLEVLEDHAFVLDGAGRISAVLPPDAPGRAALLAEAGAADRLERLPPDAFLIPGLVDLHVHAPQWPQLGKALDAPLEVWLQKYTFPLEARFADPDFARRVYDDLVQTLLDQGTTTAVYFGSVDVEPNLILAEACLRHGQRALVGKVAMDDPAQCPEDYRDARAEAGIAATRDFVLRLREMAQDTGELPLVLPVITPRFIPTCTDALLAGLGALAEELGCHVQTHCSESDWEVGHVHDRLGCTDCAALERFGLLREGTVLAHSNFITEADMGLIREAGSAVAHCPMSNAYFANAVFPLRDALERGVKVGLGTDISGGFSASLFDAARHALMASRLAAAGTDPGLAPELRGPGGAALSTVETFWLATAGGGEALALPLGQFRVGAPFDALVVQANAPGCAFRRFDAEEPLAEVFEKLVLSADRGAIRSVWVDGRLRRGEALRG